MKNYSKPFINDEEIELEDVIAASNGGDTQDGIKVDPWDSWEDE